MSLKEIAKQRILKELLDRVRLSEGGGSNGSGEKNYIAMIVDSSTLRILASCCKVYDILQEGVAVVEDIAKKRQPLPLLNAIYFLSPTVSSVELLCLDFTQEKNPQYKSAHLCFSLPIRNKSVIFDRIANTPGLVSRLKSFVEFNIGFSAIEKRVFHFNNPLLLSSFFPIIESSVVEQLTDELLTLCLSLGDLSNVRFHSNSLGINEKIAVALHQKLSNVNIPGLTRGNTTLVILDRSIEVSPLFLHEYTYQAYIYDVLGVPICSSVTEEQKRKQLSGDSFRADDTIEYLVPVANGKQEKRVALLDEHDDVYMRYRHQHLMVALKKISEEMKTFLSENAAAKFRNKQDISNEEMQRAIRDLPEYQEMLAKYNVHHWITQQCFSEFNRQGLNKLGSLEQDLATGVDSNGKEVSVKKLLTNFGALLADSSLGNEEKTRLLLLYFSMISGVKDEDRHKMLEAAQLPLETTRCVQSFLKLGLHDMDKETSDSKSSSHTHKVHEDKARLTFFSQRAKSIDIALSRFQPYIKKVMEQAAQDTLHAGKYPYVAEPDYKRVNLLEFKPTTAAAVRARNKDWDFGDFIEPDEKSPNRRLSTSLQSSPQNSIKSEKAIVIFIIGGITLSETRSAYEVSRKLGCEIFAGGTSILTPRKVLQGLKEISQKGGGTRLD